MTPDMPPDEAAPPEPEDGQRYWADLPVDKFCIEAFKRFLPNATAYSSGGVGGMFQSLYLAARAAFYGAMPMDWTADKPSSAYVSRTGPGGNSSALKVNNLRTNALAQHQIVTAPVLAWKAQAVNTDSRSMANASRGSKILEFLWKNSNCDMRLLSQTMGAILYGEEFTFSPWSKMAGEKTGYDQTANRVAYKGDVVDHYVPTWDLLRDTTASSYEGSPWKCPRLWLNKWDLIAEFPEKRADILAVAAMAPTFKLGLPLLQQADPDRIPVYFFFHEQRACLPLGRQSILLSDSVWLADGPLEECYQEILPIHRLAAGDLKGTPWAYTSFWEGMAIQELTDDVQSSLATNIVTFGRQSIWAEKGTNIEPDSLAAGPLMLYGEPGKPAIVPLQLTAQPVQAFEHLDNLKQNGREVFGLNDIAMGQPDTAQMNAQAFALLASMAIQQNSDLQKRVVKCATDMGRSRLRIFRAKASEPRKVAIVGKHGPLNAIQETFTGKDFGALDDVYVEIDSPLAQTAAGRVQLAELYKDFTLTPEQKQSVVETGRLEPLTQGLQAELIFMAEENEGLLEGKEQPVKITDSHQMHIREHKAVTFSAQARANPQINVVTDAHIQQHMDFLLNTDPRILQAMGQAAPAPMMGPPGAPPPGMGPPSGDEGKPADPGEVLAAPGGPPSGEAIPPIQAPTNPLTNAPLAAPQPV